MSLTIKTNLASLIAQSSLTNSTNKLNQAIERMTTGYKINHASDNAANYSIATNMTTKINAYQVAEDNVSMGLDLAKTASSTLESMGDLTTRLRALATQAQNGTYGNQSINALTKEANSIVSEINRLQTTAEYNGIKLFSNGTATQSLDPTNPITTYSGDVAVQSSSSKFIAPITRRDTSGMTKLADVDENTELTSGTYSISTAEELAKLATMTNNGKIGANTEFVLANDIDLSVYSNNAGWTPIGYGSPFKARFDGNGYTVSNVKINPQKRANGFFWVASNATISNLALEDVNINGVANVGGLVGAADNSTKIENCYVTGNITGEGYVGGLVGQGSSGTITDCYANVVVACSNSTNMSYSFGGLIGTASSMNLSNCYSAGDVKAASDVGGLVGSASSTTITNCHSTSNVTGTTNVGGLLGANGDDVATMVTETVSIKNSYATGKVKIDAQDGVGGGLVGKAYSGFDGYELILENSYYTDTTGQAEGIGEGTPTSGSAVRISMKELDELIAQNVLPPYYKTPSNAGDMSLILQVGINANESSQIGLTIQGIDLSPLDNLDLQSDTIFETLDSILAKINDQQTSLGAAQNRLMSALDEISTQYENLVSSRSTLRDADIADVSSEYIKMQILQNASATLMSTANQSPALALQLL